MGEYTNVRFEPWVGKDYEQQDFKIMHIGESFYLWPEVIEEKGGIEKARDYVNSMRDFTEIVIKDYFEGKSRQPTYTKAARISFDDDRITAWNKMIFYNFVQGVIGAAPKDKSFLSDELIEESQKAFFEVLERFNPDLVIIWGTGVLSEEWMPYLEWDYIDKNALVWKYKKYDKITFWTIYHPSSPAFNIWYSQNWYRETFERIKPNQFN